MINNKSQFRKALKDNKGSIRIVREYNWYVNNKVKVGSIATNDNIQCLSETSEEALKRNGFIKLSESEVKENLKYSNIPYTYKKAVMINKIEEVEKWKKIQY